MKRYLELSFDDNKGVTCSRCMLSFTNGDKEHCSALGNRPICPIEGCHRDCPLKSANEQN